MKHWKWIYCTVVWIVGYLPAPAVEIGGKVTAMADGELTIAIEGSWVPAKGDPVRILADIDGLVLEAGTAEVVSAREGTVRAKVKSGNPNVLMKAVIDSARAAPADADPDELFRTAYDLYTTGYPEGQDPKIRVTLKHLKEDQATQVKALFQAAAEAGHPEAAWFRAQLYWSELRPFSKDRGKVHPWIAQAAEGGVLPAQVELGTLYMFGHDGHPQDADLAAEWFRKAADQGHAKAAYEFSSAYKELPLAGEYLIRSAEAGYLPAQKRLGNFYCNISGYPQPREDGEYSPYQIKQGMEWYRQAAEQGDKASMLELGRLHFRGGTFGVLDIDTFHKMRQRGMRDNHPFILQLQSKRIESDHAKARKWLLKAVGYQGLDRHAVPRLLGHLHIAPDGASSDLSEGFKWFLKAAEAGDAESQVMVSRLYALGWGAPKDPEASYEWAGKAAANSELSQQGWGWLELGQCFLEGRGCEKDVGRALELFRKAADAKCGMAMLKLGHLYEKGNGVPQNPTTAAGYYRMATTMPPTPLVFPMETAHRGIAWAALAHLQLTGQLPDADPASPLVQEAIDESEYWMGPNPVATRCRGLLQLQEKNHEEAARTFQQAIDQGDILSQYHLGELYRRGKGVEKDRDKAVALFRAAAREGNQEALDALEKMSKGWWNPFD